MKAPHTVTVYDHLTKYGSITGAEAWDLYHIYRLSAVIFILRKRGFNIITINHVEYDDEGNMKRWGEYFLVKGA